MKTVLRKNKSFILSIVVVETFVIGIVVNAFVDLGSLDEIKGEKVEIVSPSVNCIEGY